MQGFAGKLNELRAYQIKDVKCRERENPNLCEYEECKYFDDEEPDFGCALFILCDECLKSPNAIKSMLINYDELFGD
jgi:hypothetical protein